ncbi:MAG: TetR/AcrR family transcriptional regulator [Candidatus Cloacimonadota bacterium]|nr:TetR/AcrR family transcriptional regulator [Candidatus Cloacimonadota bacterium]
MKKNKKLSLKQLTKRKAIIEAAIETFSRRGFHKTKISQIAKTAGVADGTVYLYFKDKDDLLIKAFEELFGEKLINIQNKIERETSARDKILKFIDYHIDLFTENPSVARFLAIELRQSPDFYESYPEYEPLKKYLDYLKKLADVAIAEGDIRKVDTEALGYLIFGTMDFLLTEWSTRNQKFSLQEKKEQIVDIVRNGIKVK